MLPCVPDMKADCRNRRLRRCALTFAVSTPISKGFTTKSSPPIFIAMTIFMLSDADEMNITGTLDIFRISRHQ